jgi:hypothetical protein
MLSVILDFYIDIVPPELRYSNQILPRVPQPPTSFAPEPLQEINITSNTAIESDRSSRLSDRPKGRRAARMKIGVGRTPRLLLLAAPPVLVMPKSQIVFSQSDRHPILPASQEKAASHESVKNIQNLVVTVGFGDYISCESLA